MFSNTFSRHKNFHHLNINRILHHAAHHSPYYEEQYWAVKIRSNLNVSLGDVPITPIHDFKKFNERFFARARPKSHGVVGQLYTSGSTGSPSRILRTRLAHEQIFKEYFRLKNGWDMDSYKILIRQIPPSTQSEGEVKEHRLENGKTRFEISTLRSDAVADLLERTKADYLKIYPSIVLDVLETAPNLETLKFIETRGETVTPELREKVTALPNCRLFDFYGSIETGPIAGLCSSCGKYHPAEGHAIVEFLDSDGNPAPPGTFARVIVTPFFNYAMPLLRFDIGDYVQLSEGHSCPKAKTSIEAVFGRENCLFKLPQGGKVMARYDNALAKRLGLRKLKFFQVALDQVDIHYIPIDDAVSLSEADAQKLLNQMPDQFQANPIRVESIPPSPSGKYFVHECLI